mgnify:CR=1 FL=1|tara:strand:- start:215 stop:478 length:264 start_codon:yes stop_codon:yes gene_type:complete
MLGRNTGIVNGNYSAHFLRKSELNSYYIFTLKYQLSDRDCDPDALVERLIEASPDLVGLTDVADIVGVLTSSPVNKGSEESFLLTPA